MISASGAIIGFLIATIYVGYVVGGDYVNGAIQGALVGIVAAIILFILALIGFGVAAGLTDIIILAIIGAIGGLIGVLIGGRGRVDSKPGLILNFFGKYLMRNHKNVLFIFE